MPPKSSAHNIFGSSTEFCLARVFSSVFKESEDLIQARHGVAFDPVHPSRIGQRQRSLPHSSSAAPAVKREEDEDWGK